MGPFATTARQSKGLPRAIDGEATSSWDAPGYCTEDLSIVKDTKWWARTGTREVFGRWHHLTRQRKTDGHPQSRRKGWALHMQGIDTLSLSKSYVSPTWNK